MSQYTFLKILIFSFLVGVAILIAIADIAAFNYPSELPEYPLSCGLSQPNESESYTTTAITYIMIGKTMVPQYLVATHYRRDLICANGTTIFEYE